MCDCACIEGVALSATEGGVNKGIACYVCLTVGGGLPVCCIESEVDA